MPEQSISEELKEAKARISSLEMALAESEKLHRDLVRRTTAVSWEMDLSTGRFTYMSPHVLSLSGFPATAWVDFDFWKAQIHPEDREWAAGHCATETEAGLNHIFDYRILNAEGGVVWIRDEVTVIKRGGKPVELHGHFVNVTEYKLASEALRESEEKLRAVFKSAPDYLMLLDCEHKIQMINRMEPGLTLEQVIGTQIYAFAPSEEQGKNVKALLDKGLQNGERQTWDTDYPRPDGSTAYFAAISAPIIVDDKVVGTVVSSRETTAQVQLAEDRARFDERNHHAQKMEAIGRLAGGVAHDFNNVLCAITGNAALALDELSEETDARESVEEIAEAAERATELTRQLLAFSRKQEIQPKVIRLGDVVKRLRSMLSRLIGENIALEISGDEDSGCLRGDRGQVEQVVLNLAINARDAMPSGGSLVINVTDVALEERFCATHPGLRPGPYVALKVSDDGLGMNDEVRERIFEPFYTTKEFGQGTGLGLAMVFGIVEQNGGGIDVSSSPSEGSTFTVYFPRVPAEGLRPSPEQKPVPSTNGKETILLVEDEQMVRMVAMRILERQGYKVLSAASGAEALTIVENAESAIDLLLTDVVMPEMNGWDLSVELRQRHPQLLVLFTSGYTRDAIAHQGVIAEELEFVAKPYTVEALTRRVREVLDQGD